MAQELSTAKEVPVAYYVILYLVAIVTANWLVARFGPGISPWTALAFIGLILTTRDKLHDAWHGKHLKRNMVLLIAAGSLLSIPFNAGRVALASFVAFLLSETVDTLVYHRLLHQPRLLRINGSNLLSALVDSIAFPALAFGFPLLFGIMFWQFVAKVGGGFLWSLVLEAWQRRRLV